jgi:hypothetical protein
VSAPDIHPDLRAVRQLKLLIGAVPKSYEMNFLGSGWAWVTKQDGKSFWVHTRTGLVLPSSKEL